jgi:hypothetical protein
MKKLFSCADAYLRRSDWRDLALLKLCLTAFGLLVGLNVSEKRRGCATFWAKTVFFFTFVPIMKKFFDIVAEDSSC